MIREFRYKILKTSDPGEDGVVTELGYGATEPPAKGRGVKYINIRKEKVAPECGPYLVIENDDIEAKYGEPAPDPERKGFWDNLRRQLEASAKFREYEPDNLDTYNASVALLVFNGVAQHGNIWAKNVALVDGNKQALFEHHAVVGAIAEKDKKNTPEFYHNLRVAAGKPDLFVQFVAYGDGRNWAQEIAQRIKANDYRNMGVSYSSEGEYGNAEVILLPTGVPMAEPAWLAEARASIGKYFDADAPKLAREVAAKYPDMEKYAAQATSKTPWCGIFFAAMMTRAGIRPPYDNDNVDTDDFMWADAPIEAKWGTIISRAEAQPGDVVVLRTPHHITFFDGSNGSDRFFGIGGNQGDAVTRASFSWDGVRAVVRPPTAQPKPVSSRFAVCLPRVLKHEGGDDDDLRDPGGRTSRGITAERWAEWRKTHPGLPADVWEAPQAEVEAIYKEKYWDVLWCDGLPPGVDYAVFDFGVNSGPSRSAKFLQEIVGSEVDGEVGPNTVAATKAADGEEVINALCDNRMYFLKGLSGWPTYGNGWTNRVNDVQRDALMDWQTIKDVVQEPDEPEEPDDQPQSIPAVEAALKDIVAALRPILEKHMEPKPVTQSNFDWGKLLQPLLAELAPKIIPLLMPYVAQMLPQLLPYLLDAMFKPRQSIMSKPAVQMGVSGIGGGLLVAIADHFLNK